MTQNLRDHREWRPLLQKGASQRMSKGVKSMSSPAWNCDSCQTDVFCNDVVEVGVFAKGFKWSIQAHKQLRRIACGPRILEIVDHRPTYIAQNGIRNLRTGFFLRNRQGFGHPVKGREFQCLDVSCTYSKFGDEKENSIVSLAKGLPRSIASSIRFTSCGSHVEGTAG